MAKASPARGTRRSVLRASSRDASVERGGTSSPRPARAAGRAPIDPWPAVSSPWASTQPSLARPVGPAGRSTASRAEPAQLMAREPPADERGEVDVEQVALEVGLPVRRPVWREVERPLDRGVRPSQSAGRRRRRARRAGSGSPSIVLSASVVRDRLGLAVADQASARSACRTPSTAEPVADSCSRRSASGRPGTRRRPRGAVAELRRRPRSSSQVGAARLIRSKGTRRERWSRAPTWAMASFGLSPRSRRPSVSSVSSRSPTAEPDLVGPGDLGQAPAAAAPPAAGRSPGRPPRPAGDTHPLAA